MASRGLRFASISDMPEKMRQQVARQVIPATISGAAKQPMLPASKTRSLGVKTERHKRGMNRWEAKYAGLLELEKRAGHIADYGFERMRFKIADGEAGEAWFKPDFDIVDPAGRLSIVEIKGHWREAARLRWKAFRDQYPHLSAKVARLVDNAWRYE